MHIAEKLFAVMSLNPEMFNSIGFIFNLKKHKKRNKGVLTPVSFFDFTYVRVHGAGFLFAHRPWTVYLQPVYDSKRL